MVRPQKRTFDCVIWSWKIPSFTDAQKTVFPNLGAFMGDFDIGEFLWMDKPADWMDK